MLRCRLMELILKLLRLILQQLYAVAKPQDKDAEPIRIHLIMIQMKQHGLPH